LRLTAGCVLMDLANPAISGTSVFANGLIKANKMHYFSTLFAKALYMLWTGPLSIIRSISTLYMYAPLWFGIHKGLIRHVI